MRSFPLAAAVLLLLAGCGSSGGSNISFLSATSVTSGDYHSCALLSGGTVKCWGRNDNGQLGSAVGTSSADPSLVDNLTGAEAVSAGGEHTCALISGGTVKCWGKNSSGQLGNSTNSGSISPVDVTGISTAASISAGKDHTCAALSDGTVRCWGEGFTGQLGNSSNADSSAPVAVTGITNATAVSAGGGHTCALLSGGTVKCWGLNTSGQLGNNTVASTNSPVTVVGISTAVEVSSGDNHTCARLSDGTVRCWGDNSSAQVGALWTLSGGSILTFSPAPASTVSAVTSALSLSSGGTHTCAALSDGAVRCWGSNLSGQLGNGSNVGLAPPGPGAPSTITYQPVTPLLSEAATLVDSGLAHACARASTGSVWCWGANDFGQLGDGTFLTSPIPVHTID